MTGLKMLLGERLDKELGAEALYDLIYTVEERIEDAKEYIQSIETRILEVEQELRENSCPIK